MQTTLVCITDYTDERIARSRRTRRAQVSPPSVTSVKSVMQTAGVRMWTRLRAMLITATRIRKQNTNREPL